MGPAEPYAHVCEAFSLTYTIRMHLHFYVTYAIIALRHSAELQGQRRHRERGRERERAGPDTFQREGERE